MRVAIYGGSFNPPHVGHGMVAAWLLWTDQVDEVWLTPARNHPFGKTLQPFALRRDLCEALAATIAKEVKVSTIEASLSTPSYTIDTLRALAAQHSHHFRLVIGADIVPQTSRWKEWPSIEANFDPIIVGRGGYPEIEGTPTFPEISSTMIRKRHNDGRSIRTLVPTAVLHLLRGVRFTV